LENVEVRLSHLEYRVRCIEGTATHDDKWSTPAMASGYTPAEISDYTPATTTTGYTPPWDYSSQRYTNSLGHTSAPFAQGYTPSTEYSLVPPPPEYTPSLQYNSASRYTPSTYNPASAWPNCQVTAPPFTPTLQSYGQMSSTPPQYTPSPVGAGVTGVPSPICVDLTPSQPSQNITPPPSVVPRPFLAKGRPNTRYLSSSSIPTHQLRNIDEVIAQNRSLVHKDTAGTLCQILAREAVFGKDILARCTVTGNGGKTALPLQEMNSLKMKIFSLFPAYHSSPEQFESVWKRCTTSIEQACGRHRREMEKRGNL